MLAFCLHIRKMRFVFQDQKLKSNQLEKAFFSSKSDGKDIAIVGNELRNMLPPAKHLFSSQHKTSQNTCTVVAIKVALK